jgi:hypothetical protein
VSYTEEDLNDDGEHINKNKVCYAYLSLVGCSDLENFYLKNNTGYTHVMYQPNGTNPSFYQNAFEASKPIASINGSPAAAWANLSTTLPVPASRYE